MLIAAKDVNQAVQMATEMRDAGEYQWFRGQTCNWTLQSSLARRHDSHDKEISRANLFLNWVQLTDGLETLSSNLDSAVAVAQHYGIATHFIDFTTEPHVAGYFASEGITAQEPKAFGLDAEEKRFFGKMPATADIGCILCFNREKVMRVWDLVSGHLPEEAKPECLQLQVADLWRLEAQHGVFFYCPVDRFEEVVYDFDRIVFPHTGQVEWPPENMIYPDRKSHLEQLLDQYFQLEKIKAGRPLFDKLSAAVKAKPLVIEDSSGSADPRYLANGLVPRHPSWTEIDLNLYTSPPAERFFEAHTATTCTLHLMSGDPGSVTNSVREQVLRFLHFEPETRRHVVRWAVNQEVNYGEAFVKAATSVFDVMRSLPYTDDELAVAIGTCAGLLTANEQWSGDFWQRARAVSALFFGSDSIEVEIAIATDTLAYTRAIVGRKDLLSAFRDDLWTFFTEQGKARYTQDPQYLLSSFGIPDALFPFDRFRRLLYSQVVPTQAVWRPDLPLIASPTRVFKLGLP